MSKKPRRGAQYAEVRVCVVKRGAYARSFFLTVQGDEVYTGFHEHGQGEESRASFHASGASHLRLVNGGRVRPSAMGPQLKDLTEPSLLFGSALDSFPSSLRFEYRPRPDSAQRKTLHVDHALAHLTMVDLHSVPAGANERVTDLLESDQLMKNVQHTLVDWTVPWFLVRVRIPNERVIERSAELIAWTREHPDEPFPGAVHRSPEDSAHIVVVEPGATVITPSGEVPELHRVRRARRRRPPHR